MSLITFSPLHKHTLIVVAPEFGGISWTKSPFYMRVKDLGRLNAISSPLTPVHPSSLHFTPPCFDVGVKQSDGE